MEGFLHCEDEVRVGVRFLPPQACSLKAAYKFCYSQQIFGGSSIITTHVKIWGLFTVMQLQDSCVARIASLGGKIGCGQGGRSANRVLTLEVTRGSLENRGHCFLSRNVLVEDMMLPIFSNL